MKNVRMLAVVVAGACMATVLLALGVNATAQEAREKVRSADVIMLRCTTAESSFTVKAYTGSTNAPAKRTDSCPETLSLLMRDGFQVSGVGYSDHDTDFVVYTLTR